jgi:hypothetical protein
MGDENTEPPKIEEEESAKIEEIPVELPEEAIPEPPIIEEIVADGAKPKKKGRPKGSADKKPRPPRKKVVVHEEPIDEKENDLPRALPDSLPIPTEAKTDKAALMLELLQRQAHARKRQKADLWKSWFQ